mmetsp:Transcript_12999/g.35670  ORF Transcript_12999/g.35670 Transcript_12999/m.35670 type:complete len:363 (-) Transcript_12999:301-1389(-)
MARTEGWKMSRCIKHIKQIGCTPEIPASTSNGWRIESISRSKCPRWLSQHLARNLARNLARRRDRPWVEVEGVPTGKSYRVGTTRSAPIPSSIPICPETGPPAGAPSSPWARRWATSPSWPCPWERPCPAPAPRTGRGGQSLGPCPARLGSRPWARGMLAGPWDCSLRRVQARPLGCRGSHQTPPREPTPAAQVGAQVRPCHRRAGQRLARPWARQSLAGAPALLRPSTEAAAPGRRRHCHLRASTALCREEADAMVSSHAVEASCWHRQSLASASSAGAWAWAPRSRLQRDMRTPPASWAQPAASAASSPSAAPLRLVPQLLQLLQLAEHGARRDAALFRHCEKVLPPAVAPAPRRRRAAA